MMLLCLSLCLFLSDLTHASIWPAPQSFTNGTGSLWIAENVTFSYSSHSNLYISSKSNISTSSVVTDAIQRTRQKIFKENFVPWKHRTRNEMARFEPDAQASRVYISQVNIIQTRSDEEGITSSMNDQANESYSITISSSGDTQISAPSHLGILYALESFSQLFYKHSTATGIYTNLAPVSITDAPKFAHRGLNLDVARNWFPVNTILKTIDALAINKFNRIHLHMTDAQSWPLEIESMPDLSAKGAYRPELTYSPNDISAIQTHGLRRGVEVIIEIDMPGHTTSIGHAYPELIAGFAAKPWSDYCAEPPCGSLKLNSSAVTKFIEKMFADLLPRISPYSSHFHTGGDEVNKRVYLLDETVKSDDVSVLKPLLQKFINFSHKQLRAVGITPIVWEEMAVEWNLTLGSDVIVQTWLSDNSVASVTSRGLKVLAGNYNSWYLDCGLGQWLNFENGNSFQKYYPFNDYCSPFKNWRLMYSYDPLTAVPKEEQYLVLGGEVHLWTEQVDRVNLETTLWPRTAAAGEVLWSGRQDMTGQNRSQLTAAPRLAEWRERMVERGYQAGLVQMIYCTQSASTECSL